MKGKKVMERTPFFQVFVLLLLSSLVIFLVAVGGSFAYEKVFKLEEKMPEGAMVATVLVGGLRESEAVKVLEEHIAQWRERAVMEIYYFEELVLLPVEQIQFHVEESIQTALKAGYSSLKSEFPLSILEEKLNEFTYPNVRQHIRLEVLKDDLEQKLSTLQHETLLFDLNEYFPEDSKLEPAIVAAVFKNVPNSEENLSYLADALNGAVINGHSVFSLLDILAERTTTPAKSKELNILASSLYELLLQTNFSILERHISREVPDYAELGLEAMAVPNKADLKFANPNIYDYEIAAAYENNLLTISLTGIPFLYTYDVVTEEEVIEPRTIVHFSSKRPSGEVETIRYGKNGYFINVYKIIRGFNNELLEKNKISEDYYPPVHQIEERSLYIPHNQEEIIPEDEFDKDNSSEELPNGEQVIDEDRVTEEPPVIEEPAEEFEKPIIDDPLEEPPVQK